MIGMTSLDADADEALSFIERNGLGYPNAVYDLSLFIDVGFVGWPAAMAVHDGNIVWMGHPKDISRAFLEGLAGETGDSLVGSR
jgi:hypothetical protein